MIHIWRPWKLSSFEDPHPHVHNYFTSLTLDVQFQTNHPSSPNDNNHLKENISQGWLLYVIKPFLQVGFRFQYKLINLVWLSFHFFSFSWSLTTCFFLALNSCVCSCPKLFIIIHIFGIHFQISLFYLHNLKA